ncbi:heparinase II/III family protein [Paenibacillus radicis (ex Xue et al. 2023)]|uniref:Heparinase II/III family protein n=1 Tax=Paenibacillus radicis (ex Xue et al. 2023) TaxID=2972489 RepID=A0ABT1YKB4_9BACL|nr:heparinase II/III family protein [Paenibacillus radicis (ex Xue et al. 2023)]MCR8632415.1 heparinase II/III family protein [Paenibacillus radicis (ex Xue et al. 2023)]
MKGIMKLKRLYETTRHLSRKQIAHRFAFMGKRKIVYPLRLIRMKQYYREILKSSPTIKTDFIGLPVVEREFHTIINQAYLEDLKKEVREINSGSFTFINMMHNFPGKLGWNDSKLPHLWRYNLHYFEYGITLGCYWRLFPSNLDSYNQFKRYVLDWINHNDQIGIGDGWHPYTISLRLVNWSYAYELFKPLILKDAILRDVFTQSYFIQSLFLSRNLEWDVMGNHLIENGRALVLSGLLLEHPLAIKFLNKGLSVLWSQLQEQVLEDGGHYERTPMYHQIVLRDYLEIIQILQLNGKSVPENVILKIKSMVEFHNKVLHPDGEIPLFNDSAFGIAPSPGTLRIHASSLGIGEAFQDDILENVVDFFLINTQDVKRSSAQEATNFNAKESGYYVYRNNNIFLIADAGVPSPDFLPAHAHADFGSYELSLFGRRWVVDSGIYEYQGEERNIFRGTRAHNCLILDGENQTDVYGNFRMARRAKPVQVENKVTDNFWVLKAVHDGYKYKNLYPTRLIFIMEDTMMLVIDELEVSGNHKLESYIHFDPNVNLYAQGNSFVAECDGCKVGITPFSSQGMNVKLLQGQYSPEFSVKHPNLYLMMEMQVNHGNHFIGYVIDLKGDFVSINKKNSNYEITYTNSTTLLSYDHELQYRVIEEGNRK